MSVFSELFFWVTDFFFSLLPKPVLQKWVRASHLRRYYLLAHCGRKGFLQYAGELGIRGKWTREEPDLAGEGAELARVLGAIWLGMKSRQGEVSPVYLPASSWKSILDAEWSAPRKWLEAGDVPAFEFFLRNFFRNGGISGLWAGCRMFDDFVKESRWDGVYRLASFVRQFEAWRREVPEGHLDDLDEPRVGNPWGYDMEGRLILEPAFEYHSLALRIRNLVASKAHPVVLEIGGGFGGLARQLLKIIPGVRYIGLDLPENVIIQSWFLKRSLCDRRTGVDDLREANQEGLTKVDALLLPNWALAELRLSQLDVVVNTHSFGEMNRSTLEVYFAEIARLRPEWLFHDNLSAPRSGSLYGIPTTEYPPLPGYRLVSSCESRWPRYDHRSPYPCREYLFLSNKNTS